MSTTDANAFYATWPARMSRAKSAAPDVARAFGGLFQAAMNEGAIGAREKELIALGIALGLRCDACVYTHVEKAMKAGATREQVVEAAGVAVMMQGGPAYTYLPKLLEALDAIESR